MKKVYILLGFLSILFTSKLNAGIIDMNERIATVGVTPVVIGQPSATKTIDGIAQIANTFSVSITDVITLGVDHSYPTYISDTMRVNVTLLVEELDAQNTVLNSFNQSLLISYHPLDQLTYIDRNSYKFSGASKYRITITQITKNGSSVTTLPEHLYVDASLHIEAYYNFNTSSVITNSFNTYNLDCDVAGIPDEIEVAWSAVPGAEEYQLEWTYINDYGTTAGNYIATANLNYDFRFNATRVTTTLTSYRITLSYDHGYLLWRIRPIGRSSANPSIPVPGIWTPTSVSGTVDLYSSSQQFFIQNGYEKTKNWQFSSTFAEEGKKKEVVSFFDGSLRNRQTVTKINSDNTAIVGETVYDYQGRPAVNILPSPVQPICGTNNESAIKYYNNFNKNSSSAAYNRADFDLDASDSCQNANAGPLNTVSGSSNYYSGQNPIMTKSQAFVPDAKGYPFSQVEYTPDNTGRIARQGGVGDVFQLNNGHETKYFYGSPLQIQLDRLFGSEVGDAAHYKKNVTVDPNGIYSVTYLDQEARTIATALAGDSTGNLRALPSSLNTGTSLTDDLLVKNSDGLSQKNLITVDSTSIVLSTQLLVTYQSTYLFDYSMSLTPLTDECLPSVCFNCVYDLEIDVTDNCGKSVITGGKIARTKGYFTNVNGSIVFLADCNAQNPFNASESFQVNLQPGNYNVYKKLTVNQDAINFYVDKSVDSTLNTCFKTLDQFQNYYLSIIDTSDCYVNCSSCVASLGAKDDFIAQGFGTAADYDLLVEQCMEPCKELSVCEATYKQLLLDMSPGGQYAEYLDANGNLDTVNHQLSVLYSGNKLPKNMSSPFQAWWRYPSATVNGNTYNYYLSPTGDSAKVIVVPNGSNYIPEVISTQSGKVSFDPINSYYYTYPTNLKHSKDFVDAWDESWAKSLVQYHPEYCYYLACSDFGKVQTTSDVFTSDHFDNLLRKTISMQQAADSGLVVTNYTTNTLTSNNKITAWFTLSTSQPYDPFVTNSMSFGNKGIQLQNKFLAYAIINGTTYSMPEFAAITVRCSGYGSVPTQACADAFGTDYYPSIPANQAKNDSIRNQEWTTLTAIYLAEKQKLQDSWMDDYAITSCDGYNDCIGNHYFNVFENGFGSISSGSWAGSEAGEATQPCGMYTGPLYKNKKKRFVDASDAPTSNYNSVSYQQYLSTGQCPSTLALQNLVNAIAANNQLMASNLLLTSYPEFSALYVALNAGNPGSQSLPNWYWTGVLDINGNLVVTVTDGSATVFTFTINANTNITNFPGDINGFVGMQIAFGSTSYTANAVVAVTGGVDALVSITGTVGGLNFSSCAFEPTCTSTDLAKDLAILMSALSSNNQLTSTTVNLNTGYSSFLTLQITNTIGSTSNLMYNYSVNGQGYPVLDFYNSVNNDGIRLVLKTTTPSGQLNLLGTQSIQFSNLISTGQNYFDVNAGKANTVGFPFVIHGDALLIVGGVTQQLAMGECGLGDGPACNQPEHYIREDLQALFQHELPKQPFNANVNIFASTKITQQLISYMPAGATATTGTITTTTDPTTGRITDVWTITPNAGNCSITLQHQQDVGETALDFSDLISLGPVVGYDFMSNSTNYFYVIASYIQNSVQYTDTIFGHSCLPLMNCQACPDPVAGSNPPQFTPSSAFTPGTGSTPSDCANKYNEYLTLMGVYNNWVASTGGALGFLTWLQPNGLSQADFTPERYCFCFDKFRDLINAAIDGYVTNPSQVNSVIRTNNLLRFCDLAPCAPGEPILAIPDPTIIPYSNPCVENLINTAMVNGQNHYQQYRDSVRASFENKYKRHCLQQVENFLVTFTDKEYHFTLYYYDQAGNLIKTVPPEGVHPLSINSVNDALEQKIISDRTNNTHSVFTFHTLQTKYEYNSLNQLVKQGLPDHDKTTLIETTLPNGLDNRLVVEDIQFVNNSLGYLAGHLVAGNGVDRGYLYKTMDAGASWTRINNLVASDLNKVQMVDATTGYAVGNDGIVLKTIDGGNTWDMLDLYSSSNGNIISKLNDLYFETTTTGVIVGDKGLMLYTTDGGSTFTTVPVNSTNAGITITVSDNITSVTRTNGEYYYTLTKNTTNGNYGVIFRLANITTGASDPALNTNTIKLNDVCMLPGDKAYACGADGGLYYSPNSGTDWFMKVNVLSGNLSRIFFMNDNEGVVLRDSVAGYGVLYKTFDGGLSWERASGNQYFSDLHAYYFSSGFGAKIALSGPNGALARFIMETGTDWGYSTVSPPSSSLNFTGVWAYEQQNNHAFLVAVCSNNNNLYISKTADNQNPTWVTASSSSLSTLTDISAMAFSTTAVQVSGAVTEATGKMIGFTISTNALTASFASIGSGQSSSYNTTKLISQQHVLYSGTTADRLLALNNGEKVIYSVPLSNGVVPTTETVVCTAWTNTVTMNNFSAFGEDITIVGDAGAILFADNGGNFTTYGALIEKTTNVRVLPFNDLAASSNNTIYAVGNNGTMVQRTGSSTAQVISTETKTNLNALSCNGNSEGYIAGNEGLLYNFVQSGTSAGLTVISTGVTEDLTDIALLDPKTYICGTNGVILYTPDIDNTPLTELNNAIGIKLSGVAINPSTNNGVAVGENSSVHLGFNSNRLIANGIFPPPLKSVHFKDAVTGHVCGKNFTLRNTANGGVSWNIILPTVASIADLDLNKVQTLSDGTGIAVGNSAYVGFTNLQNQVVSSSTGQSSSNNFFDVKMINQTTGYVAGGSGTTGMLLKTANGGSSWSLINPTSGTISVINSMHLFSNNSLLCVANGGGVGYYDGSTSYIANGVMKQNVSTTSDYMDVYFFDDITGYIVGKDGTLLKGTAALNTGTGLITGISWNDLEATYLNDGLNSQTVTDNMELNSIAFATNSIGFMGGSYTGTPSGYYRSLRDQGSDFSTFFWYDKLGRIIASQNTKQFNASPKNYSYTIYDALGRIIEVGEKSENTSVNKFRTVFGTTINGYYNPNAVDDTKLSAWLTDNSGARSQVTRTYYDEKNSSIASSLPLTFGPENLRKRIAHITVEQTFDGNDGTYDHATHYSYDIHGNVNTILQDNQKMAGISTALSSQRFKRMDYNYDLISGKVNKVSYQDGEADQWHHIYEYDADNRVTKVQTSNDDISYNTDAKYFYYKHGPLARTEIGDVTKGGQVQGVDYVYTLQGWIKGVNSNTLLETRDPGKDGDPLAVNKSFARDVYGYSLHYFDFDYRPIDSVNKWATIQDRFEASPFIYGDPANGTSDMHNNRFSLYNGNISAMATAFKEPYDYTSGSTPTVQPLAMSYKYDQLNRLMEARGTYNLNTTDNYWDAGVMYDGLFNNYFTYDANGNIKRQIKYDNNQQLFEDLTYRYGYDGNQNTNQNRLYHVNDAMTNNAMYTDDIDDQGTLTQNDLDNLATSVNKNYFYDELGQLSRDDQEEISSISWTVSGKISEIRRNGSSSKKTLRFDYDATGNRIAQHIYTSGMIWEKSIYYNRDAQGNVMSVYEHTFDTQAQKDYYKQKEKHIFGSSRLGMDIEQKELIGAPAPGGNFIYLLGKKLYELSNHLGNVLATITDRKIPIDDNADLITDYHQPDVMSATDYYPFGSPMPGREFNSVDYRYGYQKQEQDEELWNGAVSFKYRVEDPRLGRFFSVDPLAAKYAYNSPYAFAENKLGLGIELEGLELAGNASLLPKFSPQLNKMIAKSVSNVIFAATSLYSAIVAGSTYGYGTIVDGERFGGAHYQINTPVYKMTEYWHVYKHDDKAPGVGTTNGTVSFEEGMELMDGNITMVSVFSTFPELKNAVSKLRVFTNTGKTLRSSSIRFSQSSVNGYEKAVEAIKSGNYDPIDIVKMQDDMYTTVDNTRLLAAQNEGVNIKANVHAYDEALPESMLQRFQNNKTGEYAKTWGEAVEFRTMNQNAKFKEAYGGTGTFVQPAVNSN